MCIAEHFYCQNAQCQADPRKDDPNERKNALIECGLPDCILDDHYFLYKNGRCGECDRDDKMGNDPGYGTKQLRRRDNSYLKDVDDNEYEIAKNEVLSKKAVAASASASAS
jgi:hypothetical protein